MEQGIRHPQDTQAVRTAPGASQGEVVCECCGTLVDCELCGLNDQHGGHERWCPILWGEEER